jgi:Protein of unknown function (DUF2934)
VDESLGYAFCMRRIPSATVLLQSRSNSDKCAVSEAGRQAVGECMRPTEFRDFLFRERRLFGPQPIESVPATLTRAASNDQEQIRYRAYGFYVQNGYRDGYAMDDWLRAEAEVRGQLLDTRCSA